MHLRELAPLLISRTRNAPIQRIAALSTLVLSVIRLILESPIDPEQGLGLMERGKVLAGYHQLLDGSKSRDKHFFEVMLISNSIDHGVNPFRSWATVTDCGDISNTPFDKLVAIRELEHGMKSINSLKPKNVSSADAVRLITIGGDHTVSKYIPLIRVRILTSPCSSTDS